MPIPPLSRLRIHPLALADGADCEARWMAEVARSGRCTGHVWSGLPALVAPRSYLQLPGWQQACQARAAGGSAVRLRASGGGLVPQGPGLLNLSLAWRVPATSRPDATAIYGALAAALTRGLAGLGIELATREVSGSFCDGRFNLAAHGRKCIGTAQAWRRIDGHLVVLAHAVLVVHAQADALCRVLNDFERDAGGPRRYRPEAVTSLAQAWCEAHAAAAPPLDFERRVVAALLRGLDTAGPAPRT